MSTDKPNESEISIGECLDQIGTFRQIIGGPKEQSPDWEICYRGKKIGVEVACLMNPDGWGLEKEKGHIHLT